MTWAAQETPNQETPNPVKWTIAGCRIFVAMVWPRESGPSTTSLSTSPCSQPSLGTPSNNHKRPHQEPSTGRTKGFQLLAKPVKWTNARCQVFGAMVWPRESGPSTTTSSISPCSPAFPLGTPSNNHKRPHQEPNKTNGNEVVSAACKARKMDNCRVRVFGAMAWPREWGPSTTISSISPCSQPFSRNDHLLVKAHKAIKWTVAGCRVFGAVVWRGNRDP